jgi:hypothetical protein
MFLPLRRRKLVGRGVQQRQVFRRYCWIHQAKTDRSEMHTARDVIEHLSETFTSGED